MPYEITYRNKTTNSNPITITSSTPSVDIDGVIDGNVYEISIVAINSIGIRSPRTYLPDYTVVGKTQPPANVTGFYVTSTKYGNYLYWNPNTDIDLREYEIRKGNTFLTSIIIQSGSLASSFTDTNLSIGNQTYWIRAQDTSDNFSTSATSVTSTSLVNQVVNPSASLVNKEYKLTWAEPTATFAISHYEIRYGSSWASASSTAVTTKSTLYQNPVTWSGERIYYVAAVDIAGNLGTPVSLSINISSPALPTVTAQVIDNNVLLYWNDSKTSLPVDYYEIRQSTGTVYASASVTGTKSGLFTVLFEMQAGTYTYWVTGIDSAGNYGSNGSITVTVNQPPNYVLALDYHSTFTGTKSNAIMDLDDLSLPHNLTETFEEHFTTKRVLSLTIDSGGSGYAVNDTFKLNTGTYPGSEYAVGKVTSVSGSAVTAASIVYLGEYTVAPSNAGATVVLTGSGNNALTVTPVLNGTSGWATPQEQVDDGFSYFSQPSETTGYYEETIDYGTVLSSSRVSVILDTTHTIGTPTVTITISSSTDNVNFTDYVGVSSVYLTNFRYIKFRITANSTAGLHLLNIRSINIKFDAKLISETNTSKAFDVVTGLSYSQTGTTLTVTQTSHNRSVGEFVDLAFTSGLGTNGIYEIQSVPASNTYTVTMPSSNSTSGSVNSDTNGTPVVMTTTFVDVASIHAQYIGTTVNNTVVVDFTDAPNPTYFKILLYNSSGNRITSLTDNKVSWTVEGY